MLEPLTALGVASNIIQLVGFAARIVENVEAVLKSSVNALPANSELLRLASNYESLCLDVNSTMDKQQQLNASEQAAKKTSAELSDEVKLLLTDLDNLEISSSTTKIVKALSAVRQTVRTHRKGRDLEARQRRLNQLTNLLSTTLLLMLSEQSDRRIDELRSALEAHGIQNSDDVQKLQANVLSLVKSHEQNALREREEAIRRSLLFESMEYRRNIIPERHRGTFEWCFQKKSSPLLDWLETGSKIFWICGKAGSGKSTFMKFLGHHKTTLSALKTWAGSCQLVVAEHFFYYAGSHMQKSHQGLLQSLLSQVLQAGASRNIAAGLCNDRYSGSDGEASRPWSRSEVLEALCSLEKLDGMKFCFFIDGLDEYHPQTDYRELIVELTELAKMANVKICASSRPWTTFVEAFGNCDQRLRLEDLTRGDITEYVKGNLAAATPSVGSLAAHCTPQILEELGASIANKAQGVFLWVFLVVSALKEHLGAGSSIAKLRACIQSFPSELEDFFRSLIYERIHEIWRSDTAQALKLAWLILQHAEERSNQLVPENPDTVDQQRFNSLYSIPSRGSSQDHASCSHSKESPGSFGNLAALRSFLPFWILRTGMQKPKFAVTMELSTFPHSKMSDMIMIVRSYLSACCKDLLWIPPAQTENETKPHDYKVEFMHRTVHDFIATPEIAELLDRNVPRHFHGEGFLVDVTVACLKVIVGRPPYTISDRCEVFLDAVCGVLHIAEREAHIDPPQQLVALTELDCVGSQYVGLYCCATATDHCLDAQSVCYLLELMISRQLYSYAKLCLRRCQWKVLEHHAPTKLKNRREKDKKCTVPPSSKAYAVLLASLGLRSTRMFPIHQVDKELVQLLLDHDFSPNMIVPQRTVNAAPCTVWTVFLQDWLASWRIAKSTGLPVKKRNEASIEYWELAKLMIAFKADLLADIPRVSDTTLKGRTTAADRPSGTILGMREQQISHGRESKRDYCVKDILDQCVPQCKRNELYSIPTHCRVAILTHPR